MSYVKDYFMYYKGLYDRQIASTEKPEAESGIKYDGEKPRVDLVSPLALEGLAKVLTFGATKYDAHNWRKGFDWGRVIAAAYRHLMAFQRGEDLDPESGLPHIDHLACCVMFLSEFQKTGGGNDDRFKTDAR